MEIIPKDGLNAEDGRELTERLLREQLSLQVEGYKITTSMVLNVRLKAAVEKRRIEAVGADLTDVVDRNTLREAINRVLTSEELRQHAAKFNAALAECIPAAMPRRGVEMAIDFHDEPFQGKTAALQAQTCRGKAQDGTTYFWRIGSLQVIGRGVRVTLALTDVLPKERSLSILQRLLKRGAALGFRAKVLYLDQGFCTGEIIGYLQKTHQPTVIAGPIRGKKGKGGTRALCHGRTHYRTRQTFTDGTSADLAVGPTLKRTKKTGTRQRVWLVYVLIHLDWSAQKAQQRYRRRFGIESSYRQRGQVRAQTNSGNAALRFFYRALALLVVNVWTYRRGACTRVLGQGPFRLDLNRFRLPRFIAFLRRAIEQAYGPTTSIPLYTW